MKSFLKQMLAVAFGVILAIWLTIAGCSFMVSRELQSEAESQRPELLIDWDSPSGVIPPPQMTLLKLWLRDREIPEESPPWDYRVTHWFTGDDVPQPNAYGAKHFARIEELDKSKAVTGVQFLFLDSDGGSMWCVGGALRENVPEELR